MFRLIANLVYNFGDGHSIMSPPPSRRPEIRPSPPINLQPHDRRPTSRPGSNTGQTLVKQIRPSPPINLQPHDRRSNFDRRSNSDRTLTAGQILTIGQTLTIGQILTARRSLTVQAAKQVADAVIAVCK